MIAPEGFQPHSMAFGLVFDRVFSFDDRRGTIADFVLGEAAADDSPVPREFFDTVGYHRDTVVVGNPNKPHTLSATQSKIVYTYSNKEPSTSAISPEVITQTDRFFCLIRPKFFKDNDLRRF